MTEQWQELKETIIELRDNDGTGTQQEVCKFLANYMDVLEKQMSRSEKPNKWIPREKQLPKEHKEVLTCSLGGFIEIQSIENCIGGFWENQYGDWSDIDEEEVAAWMPLSEPYKESPTGEEVDEQNE